MAEHTSTSTPAPATGGNFLLDGTDTQRPVRLTAGERLQRWRRFAREHPMPAGPETHLPGSYSHGEGTAGISPTGGPQRLEEHPLDGH